MIEFAKKEMELAKISELGYGDLLPNAVLELLECFYNQNHSGMSASIVISLFTKLSNYEPLTPLTGEEWEWNKIGENEYQNNRDSRVFKNNIQAYFIDGYVFGKPGMRYTNRNSHINITFPFTPNTIFIENEDDLSKIKEKN